MFRVAAALLAITAGLAWAGRMDKERFFELTFKVRLQSTFALAHSIFIEGHMGVADAEPVREFRPDDPVYRLAASVGQLRINHPDYVSTCTATAIAPDLIITNHHCITKGDDPQASLEFVLNALEVGDGTSYKFIWPPVEQDSALDYAILRVNISGKAGAMVPLQALRLRTVRPGESLQMLHHPNFRPLLLTRAHCRVVHEKPIEGADLVHTCRTSGGSSGALLFAASDGAIVGLHHGTMTVGGTRKTGRATTATALLAKSAELQRIVALKAAGH
jgi:hypothetical protein